MKKVIFLFCFGLAILANSTMLSAKGKVYQSGGYDNTISVDPFELSYGSFNIKYEGKINAENSFTIGGYIYNENNWDGFGVSASYRWYIWHSQANPIKGLSAGPFALLSKWNWQGSDGHHYDGGSEFSIGGELNYKWVLGDWFTVEPNLQLFVPINKYADHSYRGWGLGVSLGYSW